MTILRIRATLTDLFHSEIRNRIYEFASEHDDYEGYEKAVPWVRYCCHSHCHHRICRNPQWPVDPNRPSARSFLGLTQTCKQLRQEYRPIWLSQSCVRLRIFHVRSYIQTFYGCRAHWSTLPKLLQVSFDHRDDSVVSLSQLFRMRAACDTLKIELIPHELTLVNGPWDDRDPEDCPLCEEETISARLLAKRGCIHTEFHRESYEEYVLDEEYGYLSKLNEILNHNNSQWLDDIRSNTIISVRLDLSTDDDLLPTILVELDPESNLLAKRRNSSFVFAASHYLTRRKLMDNGHLQFKLLVSCY